jgi:hypothetical protein
VMCFASHQFLCSFHHLQGLLSSFLDLFLPHF